MTANAAARRARLGDFLRQNPFPHPLTLGFFYREKMRAIHRIAPEGPVRDVLEVGGGQGGVAALLYPGARVTNVDLDPALGASPVNRGENVRFICGDATTLPFADGSFDVVTMFDVLEHVPAHERAASEALRVLRPGGWLLASSPNERWRFPYYPVLAPLCPSEEAMFAEWGHVRRGYGGDEFQALIGFPATRQATFITPLTVICHDVAFSRLPELVRRAVCTALSPLTWAAYALHDGTSAGTETAMAWRKPG